MLTKLFIFVYVITSTLTLKSQINIYFTFDQYQITPDQQAVLDSFFNSSKGLQSFTIKGFTDTTGNTKYNYKLSQQRALAVKKYIEQKYQFTTISYYLGETDEAATNDLNRKVEIIPLQNEIIKEPKITERISFNKIYFVPSTPIIKEESYLYLEELCNKIKQLKNKKIELRGHINWFNPTDTIPVQYKTLSYDRAFAVYNYVKAKGIDVSKITCRGMGTMEMIYPYPKSLYEQEQNMRVEIVILE